MTWHHVPFHEPFVRRVKPPSSKCCSRLDSLVAFFFSFYDQHQCCNNSSYAQSSSPRSQPLWCLPPSHHPTSTPCHLRCLPKYTQRCHPNRSGHYPKLRTR